MRPSPGAAVLLGALALTGCSKIDAEPGTVSAAPTTGAVLPTPGQVRLVTPSAGTGRPSPSSTPEVDTRTTPPAGRLDPKALEKALASVRQRFGDRLAVAWAPVGSPGQARSVGSTRDIESWSTIKAPIALAIAQDADGEPDAARRAQLEAMITTSDNETASILWRALGNPEQRLQQVLRATGDPTTRPARDADGSSVSFGLTAWEPADSARFASMLPCAEHSDVVLDLMATIGHEHQWGLGQVADSRFKGGWGPSPHGYLARQIGVLPRGDGSWVAVAIAAQPKDQTHESATAAIDEATTILVSLLGADDGGGCPAQGGTGADSASGSERPGG